MSERDVDPYLSILNHLPNLQSMVTKLPFTPQDRWPREANRRSVAGGVIPSFADFVNFVNAEAGITTDPVFSREALRRLDGSLDRPDRSSQGKGRGFGKSKTSGNHNGTSHHASSHATDVTAGQQSGSCTPNSLCKFCDKNHDLDDCQEYLNKSLSQRKDFLKKKSLCFACYSPGHRSNGCAQQRTCKSCLR